MSLLTARRRAALFARRSTRLRPARLAANVRPHDDPVRLPILLLAALAALSGCTHTGYSGDGQFTDNGLLVYSRRYVIDLGSVDLSKRGTYEYKLSGMPNARFSVSIRVFEGTRNQWDVRPDYPVTVRMQMRTATGAIVIDEGGSLNSWIRSYGVLDDISDLYRTGQGRDIPVLGGGTRGERLGLKVSGGWGTYFDPECGETYTLRLEVLSSEQWTRRVGLVLVGW